MEFAFMFEDCCHVLSCDNKDMVEIGVPAVNRLNRPKRYFMEKDKPKLDIHDIPVRSNLKIIPFGYLFLKRKEGGMRLNYDTCDR